VAGRGVPGRACPRGRGRPALTRVAVLADTHLPRGARRLPERCVDELAQADLILHAGDFVAASVLEELSVYAPVEAVHGNMDEPALAALLPERRVVGVEGFRVGLVHSSGAREGRAARLVSWFPDCDAVVYGHTHIPEATRHCEVWILNPGSPTERRRAPAHSMLVLGVAGSLEPRLVALS